MRAAYAVAKREARPGSQAWYKGKMTEPRLSAHDSELLWPNPGDRPLGHGCTRGGEGAPFRHRMKQLPTGRCVCAQPRGRKHVGTATKRSQSTAVTTGSGLLAEVDSVHICSVR